MIQYLIGASFALGIYLILADYRRIPFFTTSKSLNNLAVRQKKKTSAIDIWLKDFAIWISGHIRMNEYRRMQLQIDLQSAGITLSPEMHMADAIVKSLLVGLLAIPVAFIFPLLYWRFLFI